MQGNIGERDSQDSAGEPNGAESGPRADGFVARVDARSGGRGLRPHGRVTPRRVLGARSASGSVRTRVRTRTPDRDDRACWCEVRPVRPPAAHGHGRAARRDWRFGFDTEWKCVQACAAARCKLTMHPTHNPWL